MAATTPWQTTISILSHLHHTHPSTLTHLLIGLLLLIILTSISRPPPSSNGYPLLHTIPSTGPGPLRRPCQICFSPILPKHLSTKHKPCLRTFHSTCYTDRVDANIFANLKTPLCPFCLGPLLTYEQTVQLFLWRFQKRQNRFCWRLYLNAVACGDWLAVVGAAGMIVGVVALLLLAQGLGRYRRWVLLALGWVVERTLGAALN